MAQFSWYWSSNAFPRPVSGSRMYKDNKKNKILEEEIVL
jgi:hypothetical protein